MSLPTIFDTCHLHADVHSGNIGDDEFMADVSRVVNKTTPIDYLDPAGFFANCYPTRGMKGVNDTGKFADLPILAAGPVRVAMLGGESTDLDNGLTLNLPDALDDEEGT